MKNLLLKIKKEKGITLVALVVIIIVLLILAGVSIAMLTEEHGIINKTIVVSEIAKLESYSEQIKILINEEIIERSNKNTNEPFIKSLKNRMESMDWIAYTLMIDDKGEESENFQKSNQLTIVTTDDYELIVKVDNDKLEADIISKGKAQEGNYEISYWEDEKEERIKIRKGVSIYLKECTIMKEGYPFIGWCLDKEGKGEIYEANKLYKPSGNVTLYAIFGKSIHFDANGGIGNIEDKIIRLGESITLSQSINVTKTGYKFKEWNTKTDGSGISYPDNLSVVIDDDVTILYAIWGWDNENWEIDWKQTSVDIAGVNNNYYEMNATQSANSWIQIGTKETIDLKNVKEIKLTMDCYKQWSGQAYLGLMTDKGSYKYTPSAEGMEKAVSISEGENKTTILNVSNITDSKGYYVVIRLAPNNCKVRNLEFIY